MQKALSAAVAAFIPFVDRFDQEFNRGGFAFVGDPRPPDLAKRAKQKQELLAEISRTGADLVRTLAGICQRELAVDLREFLNTLEAGHLPNYQTWRRLKAALQVMTEDVDNTQEQEKATKSNETEPNAHQTLPNPVTEPNADWLTQQRLRCYPLVPLEELRPRRPEPPDSEILTAMRAVPAALMESRFGSTTPHLPASSCEHCLNHSAWLAFAQERGHGRAAAEWAVYRLVEMGRLYVVWPSIEQHTQRSAEWAIEQAERYRGGRPATVTDWDLFECGRILQIRSMPALWEWVKAECPSNTSTSALPIGTRQSEEEKSVPAENLQSEAAQSNEAVLKPTASAPGWIDLGDAKRAILIVLNTSHERLQGKDLAPKAGYKYGTVRRHFGELQTWGYIDNTKDGYAITPTGRALVPCKSV